MPIIDKSKNRLISRAFSRAADARVSRGETRKQAVERNNKGIDHKASSTMMAGCNGAVSRSLRGFPGPSTGSLTHSIRIGSGRLEGRAVLQGVRLAGDDDLEQTGRPL